jgi:hypothetical protein
MIVCGYLTWAVLARADAVVDWNAIAQQAITTALGRSAILDIVLVQVAVYDAVEAIDGRFKPYHIEIPGASGSPAAAAAKAAHDVLVTLFPDQAATLDTTYHTYLANNGLEEDDPGVAVGQQAAAGILALRANDGRYPVNPPPFIGGTDPGVWRPTPSYNVAPGSPPGTPPGPPPSFAPGGTPWVANVTPFTLKSPSQFRALPPPRLTSGRYTRDYNEVKSLGALDSSERTLEQTDFAYFYSDNYLVLWYQGLRDIANSHLHDIGDSARLFASVSLAAADAVITAWDTKFHYVYWRPITAIQEGDNDNNPETIGDPNWRPLVNTPNYPDYTSGANNVTGAITRTLKLFFGTDVMNFSLTTGNPLAVQKTRTYTRFSDVARDVVEARIYEGIHFRTADKVGRRQGRQVAKWTFTHFLRPVNDVDGGNDGDDDHHDREDDD